MTWGRDTDDLEAIEMLSRFIDAGGNLVEASPRHGDGMATDVLAQGLNALGRHRVVLVWRGAARQEGSFWVASGARGDMLKSLDDSLARLGTDYVDAWLAPYDPEIPLTETLEALETARSSGRAYYVGVSGMPTWELAEAVTRASLGRSPMAVVEDEFSLLAARAGSGRIDSLRKRGVGFLAHSPLACGALTGKYRHSTPPDSRAASPHLRSSVLPYLNDESRGIIEAVVRAADGLDRTPTDVALAWARDFPGVCAAIVGPRTARQLDQLIEHSDPLPEPIRLVLNEVAGLQ